MKKASELKEGDVIWEGTAFVRVRGVGDVGKGRWFISFDDTTIAHKGLAGLSASRRFSEIEDEDFDIME